MTQQTTDWILQRRYGAPHCDGYGSAVYEVDANVREYNLGRNSMYLIQFNHNDGYFGVIDGYEGELAGTNQDINRNRESSITDSNGVYVDDGDEFYVTTHTYRHHLSIKRPDSSVGNMEVRVIKMEPGKGFKDSDNTA